MVAHQGGHIFELNEQQTGDQYLTDTTTTRPILFQQKEGERITSLH